MTCCGPDDPRKRRRKRLQIPTVPPAEPQTLPESALEIMRIVNQKCIDACLNFRPVLALLVALVTWACLACAPIAAQKGGRSLQAVGGSVRTELEQPENPKESSSQTTYRRVSREIVLPAGTIISNQFDSRLIVTAEATFLKENIEEGAETALGGSFADTARALGARLSAMRPVQITGIAMCIGALALFYFKWWLIGGATLAMGIGMIAVAAVLPGHEVAVLIGGGILFLLLIGGMLVAYFRGKDENKNHISDFLERSPSKPGGS